MLWYCLPLTDVPRKLPNEGDTVSGFPPRYSHHGYRRKSLLNYTRGLLVAIDNQLDSKFPYKTRRDVVRKPRNTIDARRAEIEMTRTRAIVLISRHAMLREPNNIFYVSELYGMAVRNNIRNLRPVSLADNCARQYIMRTFQQR